MSTIRSLHDLNEDVLHRILEQVVALRSNTYDLSVALKNLSITCKRMRSRCMPLLFQRCEVRISRGSVPPANIRPHVRHIHYLRAFYNFDELCARGYYHADNMPFFDPVNRTATPPPFGLELDYLPAVRSVAFELAQGGVPWFVIMKCLDHPNLTSISIDEESTWRCTTPLSIPPDLSLHGFRLTEFTYTTSQWRETESRIRGTDLQPTYTQESIYLRALVLAMSDTAESLTLPVETAPLFEMAAIDWPRLRMLSLIGEYTHPDQCRAIPLLLPRMPYLRSLSVKVIQREGTRHPRLLQALPETSFRLRSLAVSYPDPADPIFLSIGDGLTSLSLCDSPRHYFQSRYSSESLLAIFPTLTSSECLTILKRISAPQLSILELVYEADAAEDELLQYLPRAFPLLQELELHRYPASSADAVPYLHITRMLTAIKYLRALYLNLDITEDVYKSWKAPRNRKLQDQLVRSRNQRGRELVRVLQSCEHFEYVALPIHALYAGVWVLYRPAWWSGFNVEHDSPYAVDSKALQLKKYTYR